MWDSWINSGSNLSLPNNTVSFEYKKKQSHDHFGLHRDFFKYY